ncbi:hypothetical protein [Paenibacillus sp. GCM10027626]|uniref:hypothetical protein n=1 Tax=Paenibacillus sp. GCM10027626 TaxID=3273411 RepID=UPI0036423537
MRWNRDYLLRGMLRLTAAVLIIVSASACGIVKDKNGFGSKPPRPTIVVKELKNKKVNVYQSSYCWTKECADYPRPDMHLKDRKKLAVPPKATLSFQFPDIAPAEVSISLFLEDDEIQEVQLTDGSFQTPEKPGVYYFGLNAHWPIQSEIPNSGYSSSYAFAVEVQE